jgi:predicted small secreted protein
MSALGRKQTFAGSQLPSRLQTRCVQPSISILRVIKEGGSMPTKVVTALVTGLCLALAACNTVRGAAADATSAANCTENTMKSGYCK